MARLLLVLCGLSLTSGCFQPPAPTPPADPLQKGANLPGDQPVLVPDRALDQLSASEILQRLLATYRAASSYADRGVVQLEFRQNGELTGDQQRSEVQFVRPNKLAISALQTTVKSDGQRLVAVIEDTETANLDGQVLDRPAPAQLQLTDLAGDPILYDRLCGRLRRQPIQLELLLESGGLAAAFGKDVACKKLADGETDGRTCFRVEVPSPGGAFVFWIDKLSSILRRLDYPAAALVPELASDPTISDLRLSAELRGATLGGPVESSQFELAIPPQAKRMKSFVVPPRPLPSQLFGKTTGKFHFTDLSGAKIGSTDLAGTTAVLVWYHDDPACEATLEQVSLARSRLAERPDVRFLAIATDDTTTSNAQVEQRLADWKVNLPVARDLEAFGRSVFQIEAHPSLVVLDGQGRVQIFESGGNPELANQIVQIADRLKKGDDLAADILARHQRDQKQYDELVAKGGPEPGQMIELPEAVIRQATAPTRLKLAELWTCRDLKLPGNLLVVEESDKPTRIFVLEGWRTISEIDSAGKVVARHELAIPEQAAITYFRTAVDKQGKRYFVGSAPGSPRLFVFDDQWKLLRALPPADEPPLALIELQLADLGDADGTPDILAASVDEIGLIALSLEGQTLWRNKAFPNVVAIAPGQRDEFGSWAIYLAGDRGTILRVNRFGGEEPEITVKDRPIFLLAGARFAGATQAAFLGLANNERGERFAIGLSDRMTERWSYPLPPGVHQKPIEAISSSHVLAGHAGEWWLAGPDGSIHVITEDGEFLDTFFTGTALTGLAATKFGNQSVLLIASDDGVRAWSLQLPTGKER
ncbi:MAG: hypothetical protein SFU86_20575 [Pirellulaceae bacterium]|nr:hypothetical protein [Pirellulaceae bacterium]